MPRNMTGPEHIEAAQTCLADLGQARRDVDWARVAALAAAAQAHLAMADLTLRLHTAPSSVVAGRQGQRWLEAVGVDLPR